MGCLKSFLSTSGGQYQSSINMDADKTKITSFRQDFKLIYIVDAAKDGVEVLRDMKKICDDVNLGDTYTFT
jgi:hypothetical protein